MPDLATDGNQAENVDLVDLIEQPAWKTILIELVKTEKMDPWDIDIAGLADKYLLKINSLGGTDLRLPANAILACAILLRFKSGILRLSEIEEEELPKDELDEEEKEMIERILPELRNVRKIKQGKVSLDNLVEAIELMLEKSKKRKDKRFIKEEIPEFKIPFADYNISERMDGVYELIKEKADSQGLILFSKLVNGKGAVEIVDTFIPCLFLSSKERINMWQEQFFGEIFISLKNSSD